MDKDTPLPHVHTYARLGVSPIQGVGVFAIREIPAGTNIFSDDISDVHWVDAERVEREVTDPELKKYYLHFCILKDGKYGCPINFNSMTLGWYMNEPLPGQEANVAVSTNYDFVAARTIAPGEELTTVYTNFSEPMKRY